ncbi:hypothetical protein J1N35_023095 [Gossypium stocksii]|uniref:Uncharacterized protein n=1 Tax=Gossypium stocksii TaxID=47602 RepID=A0A9D4A446_9ROSI|nr:hypothetical protein J1N35_023095 [Gossypium stocksii]
MELYVVFTEADGSDPSSTTTAVNTGTKVEAKSPTTHLCSLTFNQCIRFQLQHYVNVMGQKQINRGGGHRRAPDIKPVHFLAKTIKGTSNPLLEGDNEFIDEEEDVAYEEHTGEEDD